MRGEKAGESGGHETAGMMRWLVTYADMITLLLAFFIMLYAISYLDLRKFRAAIEGFRQVFGGGGESILEGGRGLLEMGMPDKVEPLIVPLIPGKRPSLIELEQVVEKLIERSGLSEKVMVHMEERGLVVTLLTDGVLFEKGSAELSYGARRILRQLSRLINAVDNQVRVEGHTCDLPIRSRRYSSNWELSVARAVSVVRYLSESCGVSPRRLCAVGYGEHRPMLPNTSEENRRFNRRVEIVLLKSGSEEPPYGRIR